MSANPDEEPKDQETEIEATAVDNGPSHDSSANPAVRAWRWCLAHKKLSIPAGVAALLLILGIIPLTRYALAGTIVKRDYYVVVHDQETDKPVSEADVTLAGQTVKTNAEGKANFRVGVGSKKVQITKKYYKDATANVLVPITGNQVGWTQKLTATGRQVPVKVVNAISGDPLEGATVKVLDTEATTDKAGAANLVLPLQAQVYDAKVAKKGFNDASVKVILASSDAEENTFRVTPAGRVYFLSKQSGKIDVVSTNLDGTDRKTLLAGTGKEDQTSTILLASTDWKYLALHSKRDGGVYAKLFLIDTTTGKITTMDEGEASFTMVGWSGHRFVYKVDRNQIYYLDAKHFALKSYDAEALKITTLDESQAIESGGFKAAEYINSVSLTGTKVVYSKDWRYRDYYGMQIDKRTTIQEVDADGRNHRVVKDFDNNISFTSRQYEPGEVVFAYYADKGYKFYVYENGAVKEDTDLGADTLSQAYPTFLQSPDGKQTFWTESRDGKNVLFVGDQAGKSEKQIAALADFSVFGWYTDQYLLVSRKSSELFVLPVAGVRDEKELLKVSDYHKPDYSFQGYGGGYGGL